MSDEPTILEYALVVTTASSCNRPSSELRVKFILEGNVHCASVPMTVADFAKIVEEEDVVSFLKRQEVPPE
uniref:DUF104 domain-containing protein n=1 Tax=Haemonchus contortus TaxID=6289 RepID=A0A7I4YNM1_HAECO|nr:unnamed protein product [Haemonchus contortus]